eukprot:gb/GECH01010980.1/.p1 GENE.gb/GECH01010980.1/~~gb/GECH01010980.1/.p1  ORF type:complete len:117 (+),score=25.30 gb/GECH01010980.1/:1-351(+)
MASEEQFPLASSAHRFQNTNTRLVECIEDLHSQRNDLQTQISKEITEKEKVEKDLQLLQNRLEKLDESLQRKRNTLEEYDNTIDETEQAYQKILDSSKTLLTVLKKGNNNSKNSNN